MTEQFDVVDEHGEPTGILTTKAEAHEKGILHRCVSIFVFDPEGRLYVQPHVKSKGLLDHSVGGHVSAGEDYSTAAKREGEEELNLYGQVIEPVAIGVYSDENFAGVTGEFNIRPMHVFGIFECQPDSHWQFEPNEEVASIYPERIETIIQQMNTTPGRFTPGFIRTMAKFIEIKSLPFMLDFDAARVNWSKTRA